MGGEQRPEAVVDLLGRAGTGPLCGMASAELNATLLAWPPGHELADEAATDLDVLLVVLDGGGTAWVDDRQHELVRGTALLIERGRRRALRAGSEGLRYLSVHRRRGPLQLAAIPDAPRA